LSDGKNFMEYDLVYENRPTNLQIPMVRVDGPQLPS
jgi:hypothetical protein